MISNSKSAIGQPEESPEQWIVQELQEHGKELRQLYDLVLFGQNQRKIPLESLDVIERGLSHIIRRFHQLQNVKSIDSILPSLKKAQASVIKARERLLIASDILAQEQSLEKPRSPRRSRKLYKHYKKFVNCLLEAIEHLKSNY
ncbi:MAG TPA: hypothetical protein VFU49_19025 [Ktedonobacteraceae bacterium]|nr:hypothetical protein [Ktedonobacteraceae bacterium]